VKRIGLICLFVAALGVQVELADASWSTSGSGSARAKAKTMPAGNIPTASVSNRNVSVSWSQSSFGGGPNVSGYNVKRYNTSGVQQSIGSNCTGTVSGLSCTEQAVPPGSWRYSVTPRHGENWSGTESAQSTAVSVAAPSFSLSSSATVTSLPKTLSGTINNYIAGQTVTFRLNNATTGTLLSGSISPSPVPSNGTASVSVTLPSGTANGTHTIFAIGNQGDVASASVTVDIVSHFTIDTLADAHSGRSFLLTARARNSSGATVTAFDGSVNLSTNGGSISPSGSYSFTDGILTQAVKIDGPYKANQTVTVAWNGKTGTSNAFALHDWQYYFKKTTNETGSNCGSATRLRDMAEGYTGSDPEELFSRTTGGATHLRFCSPTFAAGEGLAAGTTTVEAWTTNGAGSTCQITATIYKQSGGVATSLGSTALTIPNSSGTTMRTWTISTNSTNFAAGDRLNVSLVQQDVKACDSTDIHYGGTTRRSNAKFPGAPGSAYSDAVLATSGLQSHWRLDETSGTSAADSKGSANGTYTGTDFTLGVNGLLDTDSNTAVDLGGASGRIHVPDANVPDFAGNAPFSLEIWVNPDVSDTTCRRLISKEVTDAAGIQGYRTYYCNGSFYFSRHRDGVGQTTSSATTPPNVGTTRHVVATYDGVVSRLYVDGAQVSQTNSAASLLDTSAQLGIGATPAGGSRVDGRLDEAAIYSGALSASEVRTHYQAR